MTNNTHERGNDTLLTSLQSRSSKEDYFEPLSNLPVAKYSLLKGDDDILKFEQGDKIKHGGSERLTPTITTLFVLLQYYLAMPKTGAMNWPVLQHHKLYTPYLP